MNKKIIVVGVIGLVLGLLFGSISFNSKLSSLPKPEITGGERGQFGID